MSVTLATRMGGAYPKKKIGRSLVMILAAALTVATLAVFTAEARAGWNHTIYDNFGEYAFPEPDTVGAGRRLHVRFDEPQRPSAVTINAWPKAKDGYDFEVPAGQR
jgi:hypothetical protein